MPVVLEGQLQSVEIVPDSVTVVLAGPGTVVHPLTAEEIRAVVSLDERLASARSLQIEVRLPDVLSQVNSRAEPPVVTVAPGGGAP